MAKADDSSLDPEGLRAVQLAARRALDRASAWGVHPTPTAMILEAANLKVAPASAFDPLRLMEYLIGKAEQAGSALKSAISKVFGIYDAGEQLIHIDDTVRPSKQNFSSYMRRGTTSCRPTASSFAFSRTARRRWIRKRLTCSSARLTISPALCFFRATATP